MTGLLWALTTAGAAAVCSTPAVAQSGPDQAARADAVKKIMQQLDRVQLGLRVSARDLFARYPALRAEAERVAWKAARESAVASTPQGERRVTVVVPGSTVSARLTWAVAHQQITLAKPYERAGFAGFGSRGQRYSATGRSGAATPLPAVWARVRSEDRDLAVRAARLEALGAAAQQLAAMAARRRLPGAARLAAIAAEAGWIRRNAARLQAKGAADLRAPRFRDDATVEVLVTLPAPALFAALAADPGPQPIAAESRKALAAALAKTPATGRGLGRVPAGNGGVRPRLLRAEATGRPADGSQGSARLLTAREAARQVARARLLESLRRVPVDARRTVGDVLRDRPALEQRLGRFVTANARPAVSEQRGTDRWYIKLELSLDGLDAALEGR